MKLPFSYVVLRYMHDVFTREFVNIAVVVHCPKAGFLQMKGVRSFKRPLGLFPGMDRSSVYKTVRLFGETIRHRGQSRCVGWADPPFEEFRYPI